MSLLQSSTTNLKSLSSDILHNWESMLSMTSNTGKKNIRKLRSSQSNVWKLRKSRESGSVSSWKSRLSLMHWRKKSRKAQLPQSTKKCSWRSRFMICMSSSANQMTKHGTRLTLTSMNTTHCSPTCHSHTWSSNSLRHKTEEWLLIMKRIKRLIRAKFEPWYEHTQWWWCSYRTLLLKPNFTIEIKPYKLH